MVLDREMDSLAKRKEDFFKNHEARMAELDAVAKEVDEMIKSGIKGREENKRRLDEINSLLNAL